MMPDEMMPDGVSPEEGPPDGVLFEEASLDGVLFEALREALPGNVWRDTVTPRRDHAALRALCLAACVEDVVETLVTVQSEPEDMARADVSFGHFHELDACACLRRVINDGCSILICRDLGIAWATHIAHQSRACIVRPRCQMLRWRARPRLARSMLHRHVAAAFPARHPKYHTRILRALETRTSARQRAGAWATRRLYVPGTPCDMSACLVGEPLTTRH